MFKFLLQDPNLSLPSKPNDLLCKIAKNKICNSLCYLLGVVSHKIEHV